MFAVCLQSIRVGYKFWVNKEREFPTVDGYLSKIYIADSCADRETCGSSRPDELVSRREKIFESHFNLKVDQLIYRVLFID